MLHKTSVLTWYTFGILPCFCLFTEALLFNLLHCSAGIGVLNAARKTMARMLGDTEVAFESAKRQFWVVDANVSNFILI